MNADFFETQLVAYLSLREALGFQMRAEKLLLPEFVAFVKTQGINGPIRAEMALEWACQVSAHRGPSGAARRLSIARGFLLYLQASAPETEVPAPGLLPAPRRPKPYLFTPTQLTALFEAAQASRPRGSLRPYTLSTLLGLLASTGLRVGEALRLQVAHVHLDLAPPQLHILETKFHKSRIVPLHPSTADRLRHYREQRAHLHYDGLSDAFFVSEQGQHLQYLALHNWFARLCQGLAIQPTDGRRGPCLMSFRHTFAVTCLQRWYQQGRDVQTLLPHLSVYLGHVHPQESYWYLTAVPELLSAAAQRFQAYAHAGGDSDAA
jgi:integrase